MADSPVVGVDDLHAAIFACERILRILQLLLPVTDGQQVPGLNPVVLRQETLYRVRTPFREALIVGFAAFGVGMTSQDKRAEAIPVNDVPGKR